MNVMLLKVFCYSCGRICHAYKDFEIMPKINRREVIEEGKAQRKVGQALDWI